MKILIAAPLRQELHIFREYQRGLDEMKIPEGVTVDRFFVVNDCPEVIPEIKGDYMVVNTGDVYERRDNDHYWTHENLGKMHQLRNLTVERALSAAGFPPAEDSSAGVHLTVAPRDHLSQAYCVNRRNICKK